MCKSIQANVCVTGSDRCCALNFRSRNTKPKPCFSRDIFQEALALGNVMARVVARLNRGPRSLATSKRTPLQCLEKESTQRWISLWTRMQGRNYHLRFSSMYGRSPHPWMPNRSLEGMARNLKSNQYATLQMNPLGPTNKSNVEHSDQVAAPKTKQAESHWRLAGRKSPAARLHFCRPLRLDRLP